MYTNAFKRIPAIKRKAIAAAAIVMMISTSNSYGQYAAPPQKIHYEDYGNTLNLGIGYVYFPYLDASLPIFMADYEFDVARNFTLAPYIGIASYTSGSSYYYGNDYYYYRQTIIPIGVKGTYYFDKLLNLNRYWDIYAALSLGYTFNSVTWQNGYAGNENVNDDGHLDLDLHVGAEYHITRRVGIFLDLSTGVSTAGLAIHAR